MQYLHYRISIRISRRKFNGVACISSSCSKNRYVRSMTRIVFPLYREKPVFYTCYYFKYGKMGLAHFEKFPRLISYTVSKFPKIVLSWNFYWKSTWKICRINFRIKCIFKFHFIRGEKWPRKFLGEKHSTSQRVKQVFQCGFPTRNRARFIHKSISLASVPRFRRCSAIFGVKIPPLSR